jgi:hypothetical protein
MEEMKHSSSILIEAITFGAVWIRWIRNMGKMGKILTSDDGVKDSHVWKNKGKRV